MSSRVIPDIGKRPFSAAYGGFECGRSATSTEDFFDLVDFDRKGEDVFGDIGNSISTTASSIRHLHSIFSGRQAGETKVGTTILPFNRVWRRTSFNFYHRDAVFGISTRRRFGSSGDG